MGYLSVILAAAGAYAFGAIWYMVNAKAWVKAAGIETDESGRPVGSSTAPYIVSAICMIAVAGMTRHMFAMAGIDTFSKGLTAGIGIGAFLALPWIITNYAYGMRPRTLTLIDGTFAVVGCAIIGAILGLM